MHHELHAVVGRPARFHHRGGFDTVEAIQTEVEPYHTSHERAIVDPFRSYWSESDRIFELDRPEIEVSD